MRISELKATWRNRRGLYRLNHYIKRYIQEGQFHLEDLRWRFKWNGKAVRPAEALGAALRQRPAPAHRKPKGCLNIVHVGYGNRVATGSGEGTAEDRYASVNILPGLRQFGHVSEFTVEYPSDGFEAFWKARRGQANEELLALVEGMPENPDVIIGQMSGWLIEPLTIARIRARGVTVINYCWDDTTGFYGRRIRGEWSGPAALAPVVGLTLTSSRKSCLKYQAEGGLALFWPEAGSLEIHRPYELPFEHDVSFAGGRYGYRPLLIDFLRKHGVCVAVFGPGWEGGTIPPEEMIRTYSRSRINLGFSGIGHMVKIRHLKGRDFEVPLSGGLYLTLYTPDLEVCYELGKEIVCYENKWDCLEKIRYLLNHPEEAEAIRKAGRERALRDHTWERRLDQAFRLVGLLE